MYYKKQKQKQKQKKEKSKKQTTNKKSRMWHISRQRCQKCKKVFFMIVVFKYFCILFVIAVEKFFTYYSVAFQQKLDLIGGYDISITNVKLVTDIS